MSRRKGEYASHEGLQREGVSGSESVATGSQGQLRTISLQGGGAGRNGDGNSAPGRSSNASNPTSHGDNYRSECDEPPETDPVHTCKQWPCPQCHQPRDANDDNEMTRPAVEAGKYSTEAAASTQSFFHPREPVMQATEQSEGTEGDVLLGIDDATSAPAFTHASTTQEHRGRFS